MDTETFDKEQFLKGMEELAEYEYRQYMISKTAERLATGESPFEGAINLGLRYIDL